jgi:hypothetical protein
VIPRHKASWVPSLCRTLGIVQLLGDARREHALKQALDLVVVLDSFIHTHWRTVTTNTVHQFRGSRWMPSPTQGVLGVSLQPADDAILAELHDVVLDHVANHHGLVIIASESELPFIKPVLTVELNSVKTRKL